jgi:hypothetical protein
MKAKSGLGMCLWGLALGATSFGAKTTPAKPNVVLILADDLSFGETGWYGAMKDLNGHLPADRLGDGKHSILDQSPESGPHDALKSQLADHHEPLPTIPTTSHHPTHRHP